MSSFTTEQLERYSRQILLPEVGTVGQQKLRESKVLVVGAGGLGSPVILYLAAAGVGTLGICDGDVVELSNLQRQVLYTSADLQAGKARVAAQRVHAVNPDVGVVAYGENLTAANALELVAEYDVVVDATDNFGSRYLLNDVCVLLGKPLVHGSIYRFEGQLTVLNAQSGPCYRCIFPEPPPERNEESSSRVGVFGVVPGVIGTLQAVEVLKLLLGIGAPLVGRLVLYDGLQSEFQELEVRRDPSCPACGDNQPAQS